MPCRTLQDNMSMKMFSIEKSELLSPTLFVEHNSCVCSFE